jgi:hypothetical protein
MQQNLIDTVTIDATVSELRQLVREALEISNDGRKLAMRLNDVITQTVNLQCDEIEARSHQMLARLDGFSQRI